VDGGFTAGTRDKGGREWGDRDWEEVEKDEGMVSSFVSHLRDVHGGMEPGVRTRERPRIECETG
jgi:hypothetical protein